MKRDDSADDILKDGKTYAGTTFPKSDFAYTPDDTPSHWKLRLTKTPGGAPDAGIVGAACAALGKGFRGEKVQIPTDALAAVKAKVRAAWLKCNSGRGNSEMPEAIQKGEDVMTLQEIEKRVGDQDALIAKLTADNEISKAETETVLKMSKKDRKLYASMPTDKRKEFMAADQQKRKGMLEECAQQKKAKAAEDSMDEATKSEFANAGPNRRMVMLADAEAKMVAKAKKAKSGKDDDPDDDDDLDPDDDDDEMKRKNASLTLKVAGLEDVVTKSAQTLTEIQKRERLAKFTHLAEKDLPNTAGSPVEKGEMIMKLADAFGEGTESFTKMFDTLKSADKTLGSKWFSEIGKGGDGSAMPALAKFDAKVAEISKRDNIDNSHAVEKALMEAPDLYLDYERDQRHAAQSR